MTLLEMKTAVEEITGTNTRTVSRLNSGQLELASYIKRFKRSVVNVVNGIFEFPSDCLEINAIKWNCKELIPYNGNFLPNTESGDPLFWKQYDNSIALYPSATGTAEIIYNPRPSTMILDTDVPDLPGCEEALIAYAIWKNYINAEEDEESSYWEEEWHKRRIAWLNIVAPRFKRRGVCTKVWLYR